MSKILDVKIEGQVSHQCVVPEWTPKPWVELPKYLTQILNIANQNSQATRSRYVGSMKELFNSWFFSTHEHSRHSWKEFYDSEQGSECLEVACHKIFEQVNKMMKTSFGIQELPDSRSTSTHIREWVDLLIYDQTYDGMLFERYVTKIIAEFYSLPFEMSNQIQEKQGIDAFVGVHSIQIKNSKSFKPALFMNIIKKGVNPVMYVFNETTQALTINHPDFVS